MPFQLCLKGTWFQVYVENDLDWNSKRELESEKSFTSSSFEESVVWKKSVSKILLSIPHLEEWLKNATDQDPWNAEHLNVTVEDKIPSCASILSHQLISTYSSQIDQLPDTKSFVLTRLHIQKQVFFTISIQFLNDATRIIYCKYLKNRMTLFYGQHMEW